MPSIQDVADQINAKLDQINQNTSDTVAVGNTIRGDIAQTNNKLDQLDNHLQSGIALLSTGLFAIWEVQKQAVSILNQHTEQNNTVICLLQNTNELLCGITQKLSDQLRLSEDALKATQRLEGIAERAQAEAAADYDRLLKLKSEIEACCPPPERPLEDCPPACPAREERPYEPKGQDWRPARQRRDPIG